MTTEERFFPQCLNRECPLNHSCGRVPSLVKRSPFSEVDGPVDYLFVTEHPGVRETALKNPFKGPERKLIEDAFRKHAPEKTYAFTYLVRGWPVDEKTLGRLAGKHLPNYNVDELRWVKNKSFNNHPHKNKILDLCTPYLEADIKKWQPKNVVVMGNVVKEALFPREPLTITRLYNITRGYGKASVRFMTSPRSLLQNPSGKRHWENQLEAILKNTTPKLDIEAGKDFLLTDLQDVLAYIEAFKNTANPLSVDLETLNLNKRYGNKIATIQFAETNDSGVTIPYQHPESPFNPEEQAILKKALYDLFNKPSKIPFWIGHNLKFECNVLQATIGTSILSAPMFDTMAGAFLVDENRKERAADFRYGVYTLKQLAYDYLNFDGYDQGILANRSEGNLFDLPLDKLSSYGAMDVYITRRLYHSILQEAEDQYYLEDLKRMMFHFYTPCIRMASDLEQNGFYVGKNDLRELVSPRSMLLTEMARIEAEIKESYPGKRANDLIIEKHATSRVIPLGKKPWVFDLAKGGHPQVLFFNVLGLEPGKVGKSGVPSVDSAWQGNNKGNEYVAKFSEWQGFRILYNTFATKLYDRIDPRGSDVDCNTDNRIRPSFLTTGPVTGRWACREPNLQNIPRGDNPAKKAIKNIFQAEPGHLLVQLDYKANEVRWVGILAQDENLAKAIWEGKKMFEEYRKNPSEDLLFKAKTYGDIHKQTASMIFGKPLEKISKDERQATKACVFGILYGSSVKSIADKHHKTVEEVQSWFDQFYQRFPKISLWKKKMEARAATKGWVDTPNGRRRRFPIFDLYRDDYGLFDPKDPRISSEDQGKIAECLRQSVNAPIQGIASDSGMLGAALFAEYIRQHKLPWMICNAVHDSCVYQVPYDELEPSLEKAEYFFTEGVMSYMAQNFNVNFNLPLEVDFEIGLKWGDLSEWDYSTNHLALLKKGLIE